VLAKIAPRLTFRVDNKLSNDDTKIGVELRFKSMDDFGPLAVANQVEPLRKLLDLRNQLSNLCSSLQGNDKLDQLLQQVLHDTEALNQLRAETALPDAGTPPETKKED
jgi:type VI secretion system protein ImpB